MNLGRLRLLNETERPKDAKLHLRSKQAGRESGEAGWTLQKGRFAPGQCIGSGCGGSPLPERIEAVAGIEIVRLNGGLGVDSVRFGSRAQTMTGSPTIPSRTATRSPATWTFCAASQSSAVVAGRGVTATRRHRLASVGTTRSPRG
jgi:hypothetical protein